MKHTGDYELDEINMLEQECADLEEENKRLEEENKKLKEQLDYYKRKSEWFSKIIVKYQEENKELKEDVDYFRQCYLDLKKFCEKEWFMLSDEEVTKMFNLDEIK